MSVNVVCFYVCNIFTCFLHKQERINLFILSWHKLIPTQPGQNDWFLGFKIQNTTHFIGLTQTTIEIDVPQVAFFCRGVSDEKGLRESLQLGLIKMSLIAFSCKEHELTFSFLFTFMVWFRDGFLWNTVPAWVGRRETLEPTLQGFQGWPFEPTKFTLQLFTRPCQVNEIKWRVLSKTGIWGVQRICLKPNIFRN